MFIVVVVVVVVVVCVCVCFVLYAKHIIVGLLFINIHPSITLSLCHKCKVENLELSLKRCYLQARGGRLRERKKKEKKA